MKNNVKQRAIRACLAQGITVGTAESCTGGLCAKLLTDVPGSSAVFTGGFVTYTNAQKIGLLGVDSLVIEQYTEVSEPSARAMAEGARRALDVDLAIATTGYAGPTGGTERDPVGTVYIAVATREKTVCERFSLPGAPRHRVRRAAAHRALEMVLETAEKN